MFRDREEALAHLACASYPAVLKADVLAAGKGVIIAQDEREARAAVDVFFGEKRFGETEVVLEEFLEGEELSLLALCDGERAVPLAPAQDYKRIFDGDEGRTPAGWAATRRCRGSTPTARGRSRRSVHQPVVDELRRRGTPFHGVLYAGLMMRADGEPKVLEYNARFGDPETQAVLPRLRSDLLELLEASTRPGGLEGIEPEWTRRLGRHGRARLGRLPGVVLERRRDPRARRGRGRGRLPRGHRRARRRDRHGGRPRAERDGPRRDARARRATAPTRPPSGSPSTAASFAPTSQLAQWIGSGRERRTEEFTAVPETAVP